MANGNGITEEKKARELVSIAINPFEDFAGQTTTTDKRVGDGLHKYSFTLPVPATDEEAQKYYQCDRADLIEAGVIQKYYSARHVDNVIKEQQAKGLNPNSDDAILGVTVAAQEQSWEKVARSSQTKELKELKNILGTLNMSAAEAAAFLKSMKK